MHCAQPYKSYFLADASGKATLFLSFKLIQINTIPCCTDLYSIQTTYVLGKGLCSNGIPLQRGIL